MATSLPKNESTSKFETMVNRVFRYGIAWLAFVMMLLIVSEVVARYFFGRPFGLSDEIGSFLLVTITFLGLGYTWRERGHIRVDLLVSRLPIRLRNKVRLTTRLLATAFVPVLVIALYDFVLRSYHTGKRSTHWLRTPLWIPQLPMLIGVIFLFAIMVVDLIQTVRRARKTRWENLDE